MKVERILIAILALALMLALGVQLGQAQVQPPVLSPQAQAPNAPAAPVIDAIPVQGRLTDAAGVPLNGNYTVEFRIYNVAEGGAALCGNWISTVAVSNGLFSHKIDLCDAAHAIRGDQLYLGVKVGSDPEMTPRQPIYPVPYAYTVKPGAVIKGANSILFVPGITLVKNGSADLTHWELSGGSARVYQGGGAAGNKYIRIPITLPSVLYGQPVRVDSITVYYRCQDGTKNYITETWLQKNTDVGSIVTMASEATNRTSNAATSYTLSPAGADGVLSSSVSILNLRLGLFMQDDLNFVEIGGVKLTLEHNY